MPTRLARFVIAALLACGFATTAQAQPATTITLACKGTEATGNSKPDPVSMGLIINLTAGTVQGFVDYPVTITDTHDTLIAFSGQQHEPNTFSRIDGTIDRVTGDAQAGVMLWGSSKLVYSTVYVLQCKPAERMF
jgi:hypothetical protein